MPTLQEIQSQVTALSQEDLAAFRAWFDEFEADAWNRRIEADARAGKLDGPIERAKRDDAAGKSTPL
ncbi:MAG: hypothetical protein SGI88_20805 [Candidatus Hydrogenedentes bacterium]|nr:hypothetical protein [Candidatus Hydrogenedentota bacterium]